jgi:HEXXH motif-containing protein
VAHEDARTGGGQAGRRGHVELDENSLEELAIGGGSSKVIGLLKQGEHSRRLVLLRALLDAALEHPGAMDPLAPVETAWQALERAEKRDPDAVAAVLMHPQVGSWLAYTLRRHRGGAQSPAPPFVDFGQIHAVAIAASAATGQAYETTVPLRAGRVMLPRFGMATFEGCPEWDVAEAVTADGRIWLRRGAERIDVPVTGSDGPGWWALRRLTAGDDMRLTVWLDDLDPMRDLADPVPPARLSSLELERWADLLRDAWSILVEQHHATAEALAAAVISFVPLPAADGRGTRSASTGDAFGAMMCSPPPDAVTLAVSLAHEFMHIKLGGLMHLVTLVQGSGKVFLYAPWRDDPRPADGLLQGIYAFFGIARFWRQHRHATGDAVSDFEYAYARNQTREALGIAVGDGTLTGHGLRFAKRLAAAAGGWTADEVDAEALRLAKLVADGHRAGWRIRHCRPRPEDVATLVRAWNGNEAGQIEIGPSEVLPDPAMQQWSAGRLGLARRRLVAPDLQAEARDEDWGATLTDADLALFAADLVRAADGFTGQIATDPESFDAWTGLGLALAADAQVPTHDAATLLERPELVIAVHRKIGAGHCTPAELASWIGARIRPAAEGA